VPRRASRLPGQGRSATAGACGAVRETPGRGNCVLCPAAGQGAFGYGGRARRSPTPPTGRRAKATGRTAALWGLPTAPGPWPVRGARGHGCPAGCA